MSVRDAFSACIAEYTYWRSQYNRMTSSSYAGYQGQSYGEPSGSDQQAGASGYGYGSSGYRSSFGHQDDPYERRYATPSVPGRRPFVMCKVVNLCAMAQVSCL